MTDTQFLSKHFVTLLYLLRAKEPCTQNHIYYSTHANLQDISKEEAEESFQTYLAGLEELVTAEYVNKLAADESNTENLFELTDKGRTVIKKVFD